MKKVTRNYSFTYLIPSLFEKININKKMIEGFVNSYMFTDETIDLGNLFIECKFDYSDSNFNVWESILIENELYVNSIAVDDKIIYQFKIPDKYIKDQELFILGKYSLMSKDIKNLVIKFWLEIYGNEKNFVMTVIKKIKGVFDKSESLKKELEINLNVSIPKNNELGTLIDIENETYCFNKELTN